MTRPTQRPSRRGDLSPGHGRARAGDRGEGTKPAFRGFAPPTSNTTYVPNQFFDVCLPHCSRGTLRIVGYLIRKTLGWSDAHGRPQAERHAVGYAELIARAGVSRDMIRPALDEAIDRHFILCTRPPQPKAAGKPAVTGVYELKWDTRPEYVKDPQKFRGFFAGEGNRTYVPNSFFDTLLPTESLAVLKVVGSVLRFSIGFQTKWGHRRQHVALSYQHVQNYAKLRDRKTLTAALQHALRANYLERVEEGYFDPHGGKQSKAAVYALKWLDSATDRPNGRKCPPAEQTATIQSETPTGIGRKSPPADRSENPTGLEITKRNNTLKQQPADAPAAAVSKRLQQIGFDPKAAQAIASKYPPDRIDRQLRSIGKRNAKANRLGLLRAAIEGDWPEPGTSSSGPSVPARQLGAPNRTSGAGFRQALDAAADRLLTGGKGSPSQ